MLKSTLQQTDPEIYNIIQEEAERQEYGIELIASENYTSKAVMEAMGSVLTNKYSEGYIGKRYYGGNEVIDKMEALAIERCKKLFGCDHANIQPLSGSPANAAVYMGVLKPGDKVLGLKLDHGGHLSHGHPVNFSGMLYNFVQYEVDKETGRIDMDKVREIALKEKPRMILAGFSAYSRNLDWKKFKEIADEVGALTMADISHVAGLIAGKAIESPVPYFDIVTTTTHKTLRGPRGGCILTNDEALAKKLNSAIFPGTQGGPLMHVIAAKAVCFGEALKPEFKEYQAQIRKNAQALAEGLTKRGVNLVSGGTDNHLMLVDLRGTGITGKELQNRLDEVNITANKNTVPNEPLSPFVTSGVRLGTPAVTTRGFKEPEMDKIAGFIADTIFDFENKADAIRAGVAEICQRFPLY